jgi:phosphoribosyl-ATP pyrophosphohydrolase
MGELLADLQGIVKERKDEAEVGSYTYYLFEQGIDKMLKKLGEESAETIIAAKNLSAKLQDGKGQGVAIAKEELIGEIGDLLYHLTVLCVEMGVDAGEVDYLLRSRMAKRGNLKERTLSDKNT